MHLFHEQLRSITGLPGVGSINAAEAIRKPPLYEAPGA